MPAPPSRTLALALALALATAAALGSAPAAADPRTTRERAIRLGAIAAAMVLYTVSETVAKDALSPDTCRWCSANALDARMRDLAVWSDPDQAGRISNILGYAVAPISGAGLLLAATLDGGGDWTAYGDDITAMFEIVWATQLPTQIVKITAARQRPYAHYRTGPAPLSQEDNLSFFSAHSALTFSLAVGGGLIAQRRGYRLAPVIWATGLTLAATTAYLRMAADRHYLTDVLTGSAVGALGGAFIPRLTGSFPARATLVPQPGGLALVGRF